MAAGAGLKQHHLTRREREVLALLAAGRTDGEIAQASHAQEDRVFSRGDDQGQLRSRSRVEIATDAIGLGLIDVPQRER